MEKEYIRRDTLLNGFDREGFEGIKERFERYVSSEILALYRIRNVGDYKYLLTDPEIPVAPREQSGVLCFHSR